MAEYTLATVAVVVVAAAESASENDPLIVAA